MAYGTENGVTNNLSDYEELIESGCVSEDMIGECRLAADGIIDARLSTVVDYGRLPLEEPPAVISLLSDDLTTYFVLRRVFTGSEPNDSEWVDKFYLRPLELLDKLLAKPVALGNDGGRAASTGMRRARVFTTDPGDYDGDDGTMDEW